MNIGNPEPAIGSCRFLQKDASIQKKANVQGFVSTLASFQLRYMIYTVKFLAVLKHFHSTYSANISYFFASTSCDLVLQTFFKDYMGIPLLMEPNFNDYSCQVSQKLTPLSTRQFLVLDVDRQNIKIGNRESHLCHQNSIIEFEKEFNKAPLAIVPVCFPTTSKWCLVIYLQI